MGADLEWLAAGAIKKNINQVKPALDSPAGYYYTVSNNIQSTKWTQYKQECNDGTTNHPAR